MSRTQIPEITTPSFLSVSVSPAPMGPTVRITASYSRHEAKYVASSITVEHPLEAVTGRTLRTTRLRALMVEGLREQLREANTELLDQAPVKTYFRGTRGRAVSEKTRLDPTLAQLVDAGTVYQLASSIGDFPIKAIERCFSLDNRDAQRWMRQVRRQGLL